MEDGLAAQEERTPAKVELFRAAAVEQGLRGEYDHVDNVIRINPAFVDSEYPTQEAYADDGTPVDAEQPYMAAQTVFHEDEHAHQRYVVEERPDLAESPQQLEDMQKNLAPGAYISPSEDDVLYSVQPAEVDARDVSQERMDQALTGEPGYAAHREHRVAEELSTRQDAEEQLGENYLQAARDEVYYRAQERQAITQSERDEPQQQQSTTPVPQAAQGTEQAPTDTGESESDHEEGVDESSGEEKVAEDAAASQGENGEGVPMKGPAGAEDAYDQSYDYGMGY